MKLTQKDKCNIQGLFCRESLLQQCVGIWARAKQVRKNKRHNAKKQVSLRKAGFYYDALSKGQQNVFLLFFSLIWSASQQSFLPLSVLWPRTIRLQLGVDVLGYRTYTHNASLERRIWIQPLCIIFPHTHYKTSSNYCLFITTLTLVLLVSRTQRELQNHCSRPYNTGPKWQLLVHILHIHLFPSSLRFYPT